MDASFKNFLITPLCDKRPADTAELVERRSLKDKHNNQLLGLNSIHLPHNQLRFYDASKQHMHLIDDLDMIRFNKTYLLRLDTIWISNVALVIRSTEGHALALYRQSEAQKRLYQRHCNVLLIHLLHSTNTIKTLLSISIVDSQNGIDYTVCLVTLPVRVLSKVIAHCLKIFTSHNDPSTVKAVVVNREELLPNVRKAFPMADHLISERRMLEQVSAELSKYTIEPDIRNQYYNAFAVCCSTSSEKEFGYAEACLISAPGALGIYFETTWFEQTDIWRAIDNLRRINERLNTVEVSQRLYRKLAQTMFF